MWWDYYNFQQIYLVIFYYEHVPSVLVSLQKIQRTVWDAKHPWNYVANKRSMNVDNREQETGRHEAASANNKNLKESWNKDFTQQGWNYRVTKSS